MVESTFRVDWNGVEVGSLIMGAGRVLRFRYSQEWLSHPNRRSISLSLPLGRKEYEGPAVWSFFSNLLPDNAQALERISEIFRLPPGGTFAFLEAMGRDCIGAARFHAEGSTPPEPCGMKSRKLSEEGIEEMLLSLGGFPLGMSPEEDFRLTIPGAQMKTALLRLNGEWRLPLEGAPTTHILKLPIGSMHGNTIDFSGSCENEWLCLEIARAFGLPAARADLAAFGSVRAIAVERFDRIPSKSHPGVILRLPAEDMCQALGVPPHQKYETDGGPGIGRIMKLLEQSAERERDRHVFMAAQVLMWLLDSPDAHAKNYSILLRRGDCFELAPLYDILSAAPLTASGELSERRLKLAMALIGKNRHDRMTDVQPRHFISTAKAVGFPETEMREILHNFADKTPKVIEDLRKRLPADFPETTSRPIFEIIRKRAGMLARFLES